ncbi:MAG: nicotinamide mononucleotide transporter [Bacteroidales bacterium]|nr:nicotinamide mononucleotide transporter [Bacteroidales bacterium]
MTAIKLRGAASDQTLWLLLSAFGSLMGVLATVCSANGWIITFLFGFLDVSIYGVACWVNWKEGGAGLGNALLHFLYFVPMQFVGFVQWKRRGAKGESQVKARRLSPAMRWAWLGISLVATVVLYFILARFDRSAAQGFLRVAVILDVIPLVCNVIGQLLMSTAYMEQWFFWIVVNIFSIALWINSDQSFAPVYIVKYTFYLINSFNGLRIWYNLSRQQ